MGYCIVEGCYSKSDVNQGIKLHILPQNDEERLKKWLEAIGKTAFTVAQHGRVCSRHFSINDYYKSRSGMIDCLKKEAIPSLNLPGDIDSRRMANSANYRWDENKKAYVDSSSLSGKTSLTVKREKLDDDDVIVVGEEVHEDLPDIEGPVEDLKEKAILQADLLLEEEGTCTQCEIVFRRKKDLISHLKKVHITIPSVVIEKLPNTHPKVRRLLLKRQSSNDGLKLKIRSLGSEKFQVIQEEDPIPQQPSLRILKPNEMKWSPPATDIKKEKQEPIEEVIPNNLNHQYMSSQPMNPYPNPQEGFGPNNTDDILKKLLEDQRDSPFHMNDSYIQHHPHHPQHHPHQHPHHPQGPHHDMENEYISIDNLGNICSVCQCHFSDRMELETHKRMTGHDMHMREPPPLAIMGNQQQIRFQVQAPPRGPMTWHPGRPPMLHSSPYLRPGGPGPGQMQMGPSPGPIRPQYTHHPPSGHPYSPQPIRIMSPQRGPMPPLYRVPVSVSHSQQPPPQQQQQVNQRPQHRPLFQMTSTGPGPRQSIFLKSRLQKAANVNGDGNYAVHPQQAVLSNQTTVQPRFLTPPAPAPNHYQTVTVPMGSGGSSVHSIDRLKEESSTPSPKLPKIHSVHSGVTIEDLHFDQPETTEPSPMRTTDDMANVLVQRGITITRNKPVNGVSIKTEPQTEEDGGESSSLDDSFLSCPVNTCSEKFLTESGLQRHVERGHKKEPVKVIVKGGPNLPLPTHEKPQTISIKNGMILKSFKCANCTAHFTTQPGLAQHQQLHHSREESHQAPMLKASLVKGNQVPNEVGIPLVDLSNEITRRKLLSIGITNFIPVANRDLACGGFFGFPVVSLQAASNPSICNLGELGASSILSLGPVRQIPKH